MFEKLFNKNRQMYLSRDSIEIYKNNKFIKKIPLNMIRSLNYNIDENGIYFIVETNQYLKEKHRISGSVEKFIFEMKSKGIAVNPAIGQLSNKNNFIDYCIKENKQILVITKGNDKINVHIGKFERNKYLKSSVDTIDIKSIFEISTQTNFKDEPDLSTYGMLILNNTLTFGMGYAAVHCNIIKMEGKLFVDEHFSYLKDEAKVKQYISENI